LVVVDLKFALILTPKDGRGIVVMMAAEKTCFLSPFVLGINASFSSKSFRNPIL
jgi:hypothetical protein